MCVRVAVHILYNMILTCVSVAVHILYNMILMCVRVAVHILYNMILTCVRVAVHIVMRQTDLRNAKTKVPSTCFPVNNRENNVLS